MNETSDRPAEPVLPPRLEKGDTIGVVAPAGPILKEEDFTAGIRLLREAGFEVKFSREIMRKKGYLAGDDQERARELQELWADPAVKALVSARGGYGALRLLPLMDMALIRQYPKIFVGFSDISVLHAAFFKAADLLTFHGPMLTTLPQSDRFSVQAFFEMLTGHHPQHLKPAGLEVLKPGRARGKLLGGNLASLIHLVGTPYEIPWQEAVLFLEDVCEAPYRVDRMFTHLKAAGRLEKLAGLILGTFEGCGDPEPIWARVLELVEEESFPVWANFPAGHSHRNQILPLGQQVEMDSGSGLLHLRGPTVAPL